MKVFALTAIAVLAIASPAEARELSRGQTASTIRRAESQSRSCASAVRSRGDNGLRTSSCRNWFASGPDYDEAFNSWSNNCYYDNNWSNSQCNTMTEQIGEIQSNQVEIGRY